MGGRRRLLISVEPTVLGGALAEVVDAAAAADDEIVVLDAAEPVEGDFDAAIVMADRLDITADVVIELPEGPTAIVVVNRHGQRTEIDIRDSAGLVDLVSEQLRPTPD